jgi:isocitrate/isopropylmalate dehydrogenase
VASFGRSTTVSQTVWLIEGDGIGPEVTLATRRIVDAAGVRNAVCGRV